MMIRIDAEDLTPAKCAHRECESVLQSVNADDAGQWALAVPQMLFFCPAHKTKYGVD